MNAPINDQLKAEAAKSLLERMSEKTKLVRFFRYNAAAKHGVPIDNDSIDISYSSTTSQKEPEKEKIVEQDKEKETKSTTVMQPVVIDSKDKTTDQTKGILQTLAAVAALGAALWGGMQLGKPEPTKDIQKETVTQQYQESPFQYLEDIGEHLP